MSSKTLFHVSLVTAVAGNSLLAIDRYASLLGFSADQKKGIIYLTGAASLATLYFNHKQNVA